ncbi:hypothetical protein C8255_06045 [filamentous cyanobacterium CCP3]|nr:hypothetical protein C8255_06045 [filamentous cyanobacterium CCP3]
MSNSLAIATVTAALRNLLMQVNNVSPDTIITAKPPNRARSHSDRGNQLNLFLYQISPNAAWGSQDSTGALSLANQAPKSPDLALNLYYFITAYGRDDDDLASHQLLGQIVELLHHHPEFKPGEMQLALPGNNLYQQVEQIRIIPQLLTSEELSKLWSIFQVPYSISVAYQVSVVLITGQPIGAGIQPDAEAQAEASSMEMVASSGPKLMSIQTSAPQGSPKPGDLLTLRGQGLAGDRITVRYQSLQAANCHQTVKATPGNGQTITVQWPLQPHDASRWVAGFYCLTVEISRVAVPQQWSNSLAIALAPQILDLSLVASEAASLALKVTCSLTVLPEQAAVLLVYPAAADRLVAEVLCLQAQPRSQPTNELTFPLEGMPRPGGVAMLRLDGVDSAGVALEAIATPSLVSSSSTPLPEAGAP